MSSGITHDVKGSEYAQLNKLSPGDMVRVDGDFTCLEPWSIHEVHEERGEKFICCHEGMHLLDSQLIDDTDYLVGIYPLVTP